MTGEESELRRAIDRLTSSIEKLEERVVLRVEYAADQRTTAETVSGLRDDIKGLRAGVSAVDTKVDKVEERRAADRRLILTSLVLPLVVSLVLLYIGTQVGGAP